MRPTKHNQATYLVFASKSINIIPANQAAEAVSDEREWRINVPTLDDFCQFSCRLSHVKAPIVGKFKKISLPFVSKTFDKIIA